MRLCLFRLLLPLPLSSRNRNLWILLGRLGRFITITGHNGQRLPSGMGRILKGLYMNGSGLSETYIWFMAVLVIGALMLKFVEPPMTRNRSNNTKVVIRILIAVFVLVISTLIALEFFMMAGWER